MTEQELKELALAVIYAVDYDIGKASDPDVFDECPELIDEVANVIRPHMEIKE